MAAKAVVSDDEVLLIKFEAPDIRVAPDSSLPKWHIVC
jgi:hypothetical protein